MDDVSIHIHTEEERAQVAIFLLATDKYIDETNLVRKFLQLVMIEKILAEQKNKWTVR